MKKGKKLRVWKEFQTYRDTINRDSWFLKLQIILGSLLLLGVLFFTIFVREPVGI